MTTLLLAAALAGASGLAAAAPLACLIEPSQVVDIGSPVVGVIANLALWFGWHFVMPGGRPDPWALALAGLALGLVLGLRWGVMPWRSTASRA